MIHVFFFYLPPSVSLRHFRIYRNQQLVVQ